MVPYVAALLLLVAPGYTLVRALFPARGQMAHAMEGIYVALFSVVAGVALVVPFTFLLILLDGAIPGLNLFTAPVVGGGLVAMTLALGVVGWWRGAHAWLARLHPALGRPTRGATAPILRGEAWHRIRDLGRERDRIKIAMRMGTVREEELQRLPSIEAEIRTLEARLAEGLE